MLEFIAGGAADGGVLGDPCALRFARGRAGDGLGDVGVGRTAGAEVEARCEELGGDGAESSEGEAGDGGRAARASLVAKVGIGPEPRTCGTTE